MDDTYFKWVYIWVKIFFRTQMVFFFKIYFVKNFRLKYLVLLWDYIKQIFLYGKSGRQKGCDLATMHSNNIAFFELERKYFMEILWTLSAFHIFYCFYDFLILLFSYDILFKFTKNKIFTKYNQIYFSVCFLFLTVGVATNGGGHFQPSLFMGI